VLKGVVTKEEIVYIANELGYPEVSNAVVLNVDLNGDGKYDAATFEVGTSPIPLSLSSCDPTNL
jgi:hypothetical protein